MLFGILYLVPVAQDGGAVIDFHVTENVRMLKDELAADLVSNVSVGEASRFFLDLGMENYLEHKIAKLLAKESGIVKIDPLHNLISLFYKISSNAFVILFSVPRTAPGRAKHPNYLTKLLVSIAFTFKQFFALSFILVNSFLF